MKESSFFSNKSSQERGIGKEIADVAIGSGLIVAGPEMAASVYEELAGATGTNVPFWPQNEIINHALEAGLDVTRDLTGLGASLMLIYIGYKKMLKAFDEK